MAAWRYRDADGGAFDRSWRSLVLESASAGSSLTLDFASPIAAPAAVVPFVVRYRRMDAATNTDITATATCGDGVARAVRLWPDGADGVFSGTVDIEGTEPCRLRVTVEGGASVVGGIAVTSGATHSVNAVLAKLERAVSRTSGVMTVAGDESKVADALALSAAQPGRPEPVHPMRSPWWMFPFVTCLSVEWWLRRRAGLR